MGLFSGRGRDARDARGFIVAFFRRDAIRSLSASMTIRQIEMSTNGLDFLFFFETRNISQLS